MFDEILKNSKIRETAIGLLLSYGGFSTFLPKLMQSISSVNGTTTFGALTWFALFYFLAPCFIFLTYWNFIGYRKLIQVHSERFNIEINLRPIDLKFDLIFFVAKILPFTLVFYNKFIFYNFSLFIIFYFLLIGIFEFFWFTYEIEKSIGKPWNEQYFNEKKFFQRILKYAFLISPINLVLGIGLLYFSEPWFLYQDNMILILWIALIVHFTILSFIYLYKIKDHSEVGFSLRFIYLPLLLLFSLIFFLPHVNRRIIVFETEIPATYHSLLFLGFFTLIIGLGASILSLFSGGFKKQLLNLLKRENQSSHLIKILVLILFVSLPLFFNNIIENENQDYYKKRIKAAGQITDKKLVPSFPKAADKDLKEEILLLKFIDKHNHFLRLHGNWDNVNRDSIEFAQLINEKSMLDFLFKKNSQSERDTIKKNFSNLVTIRRFFYPNYEFRNTIDEDTVKQKDINNFYSNLFIHLKDTLFPRTIIPLSRRDENSKIITNYLHPLNYYSYVVDHYKNQLHLSKNVLTNLKYLNNLNDFKKYQGNETIYLEASISSKENELIKNINKDFLEIVEIQGTDYEIKGDANKIDSTEKFFNVFLSYKENQLTDRVKSAQIIYQSYLYDYQRIGVFLFLFQLVIFGIVYIELRKERKQEQKNNDGSDKSNHSLDPIFITLITVLALMLPLMRKIKAENIDPTKKYWMLNLSNWYSPEIVFPETPILEKNEKQIQVNNNIKLESSLIEFLEKNFNKTEDNLSTFRKELDEYSKSLEDLTRDFNGSKTELDKVKVKTESIDKIIKK